MGAHAGVFFFEGRAVPDSTETMAAGLRPFAPDGASVRGGAGVAMVVGACGIWINGTTPGMPESHHPLAIAWDGRLDNRDDLLLRLGEPPNARLSDAAIVRATLEREGISALRSLVGEWSVAIWDERRRTLHLARDYMGIRPLYYCASNTAVCWSSSLAELVVRTGRAAALSDRFAASFVALRLSCDVTPYDDVRAVPTGTCVTFTAGGTATRQRFWHVQPGSVRFNDPRDYEARLRELWADAVASRLRTHGPVWAELSGGLDSSSVVCMADRLIAGGRAAAPGLQPISHATLRSAEGDERRFIAEVERRIGVRSEILGVEEHIDCEDPDAAWLTPYALRGVALACARRIRERGGRLILSGRAGDAVMGAAPDNSQAVFDDPGRWRIWTAIPAMRQWSRACRKPFLEIAASLARTCLQPGHALVAAHRRDSAGAIALLSPQLRALVPDDSAELQAMLAEVRPAKREAARLLLGYAHWARFDIPVLPPGIVYTYPYTHRPLVEFMLAIPGEEMGRPGLPRALMRRAFAPFVPPRILRRESKGYYPPAAMRGVRAALTDLPSIDRLEVVQRGWVDPTALDAAVRAVRDGGSAAGPDVRRVLLLERWLISRNRRAPADIPMRKEVNGHEVLHS